MKTLKNINNSTKKILVGALVLFSLSTLYFLYLLIINEVKFDIVWILFFTYGVVYAGIFWVCVQIAHKIKNLKLGIIMFIVILVIMFGLITFFLTK